MIVSIFVWSLLIGGLLGPSIVGQLHQDEAVVLQADPLGAYLKDSWLLAPMWPRQIRC